MQNLEHPFYFLSLFVLVQTTKGKKGLSLGLASNHATGLTDTIYYKKNFVNLTKIGVVDIRHQVGYEAAVACFGFG